MVYIVPTQGQLDMEARVEVMERKAREKARLRAERAPISSSMPVGLAISHIQTLDRERDQARQEGKREGRSQVGAMIQRLRVVAGLSGAQVAELLDVPVRIVRAMEEGDILAIGEYLEEQDGGS